MTIGATRRSAGTPRRGWIEDWHPEDPDFWESTGRQVARRYLAFIAFYVVCVAVTWTVYLRPGHRLQDV